MNTTVTDLSIHTLIHRPWGALGSGIDAVALILLVVIIVERVLISAYNGQRGVDMAPLANIVTLVLMCVFVALVGLRIAEIVRAGRLMTTLRHALQEYDRIASRRIVAIIILASFVGVVTSEILSVSWSPLAGTCVAASVVFCLVNSYLVLDPISRNVDPRPALVLLPLIQILRYALPFRQLAPVLWYAVVAAPILAGLVVLIRSRGFGARDLLLTTRRLGSDIAVGFLGIPVGVLAYLALEPDQHAVGTYWASIVFGILVVGAMALGEEILFRHLLQQPACDSLGRFGWVLVSGVYATMFIGSRSVAFTLLMGVWGLSAAYVVDRTKSLTGVVIAHALAASLLIVILPAIYS